MTLIPHRLYLMLAVAGIALMFFGPTYAWADSSGLIVQITWVQVLAFTLSIVGLKGWARTPREPGRHEEIDVPEFLK